MPNKNDGTAAARTFAVPELLEKILVNLSLVEIYRVEMVSTTFKATIAGSKRLCQLKHPEPDFDYFVSLLRCNHIRNATSPLIITRQRMVDWLNPNTPDSPLAVSLEKDFIYQDTWTPQIYASKRAALENLTSKDNSASWRGIQVTKEGQSVGISVEIERWPDMIKLDGGVTLSEIVDACVKKVLDHWELVSVIETCFELSGRESST